MRARKTDDVCSQQAVERQKDDKRPTLDGCCSQTRMNPRQQKRRLSRMMVDPRMMKMSVTADSASGAATERGLFKSPIALDWRAGNRFCFAL